MRTSPDCPKCAAPFGDTDVRCFHCGTDRPEAEPAEAPCNCDHALELASVLKSLVCSMEEGTNARPAFARARKALVRYEPRWRETLLEHDWAPPPYGTASPPCLACGQLYGEAEFICPGHK